MINLEVLLVEKANLWERKANYEPPDQNLFVLFLTNDSMQHFIEGPNVYL